MVRNYLIAEILLAAFSRSALQEKCSRRFWWHAGAPAPCRELHRHPLAAPKLLCPIGVITASSLRPKL